MTVHINCDFCGESGFNTECFEDLHLFHCIVCDRDFCEVCKEADKYFLWQGGQWTCNDCSHRVGIHPKEEIVNR